MAQLLLFTLLDVFGEKMTQFIAKVTLIAGITASMTGCAQMSFVGDNLWGFTKSTANFATKPVTGLLRPAPSQGYIFETTPKPYQIISSQHQVKNDFATNGGFDNRERVVISKLNHLSVPQTQNYRNIAQLPTNNYRANQHQPVRYQTPSLQRASKPSYRTTHKTRRISGLIPRRIVRRPYKPQENPQFRNNSYTRTQIQAESHAENQVQSNQDISFVKIGGGSNMSDWTSCQQQSGSYYQMTKTSYRIDPNFENCMRGKGYKLESEAKDELNL